MRVSSYFLFLLLIGSFGCSEPARDSNSASGSKDSGAKVLRQIDHVLIRSDRADALFALLTDKLQLPVAWPMTDFGGFASGGVAVGNVNLEIIRTDKPGARIAGFAIEPEPLSNSLEILDQRKIAYGPPAVFRSGGLLGLGGTIRWTTVALPSVSGDAVEIFLCEYPDDVSERRRKWLEELKSRKGGPLSVTSVREVVYGGGDAEALRKRWKELLAPTEASGPGVWPIGDGPAIRVVEAPEDGILEIEISVSSLARARQYLAEKGMIREDRTDEITLGGPEFEGLTVTVAQDQGVR